MTDPPRPAIRLLGLPSCLDVRSGTWRRLSDKAAALLVLLLVDGPATRSTLAGLLWADTAADQPDKARNSLSSLLRDMRRWTGAALVCGSETLDLAPGVDHDLGALAGLPADDAPLPTGMLLATIDLPRLPAFSAWLQATRGRWQRAAAQAHDSRADRLWRAGRLPEALAVARQRVAVSPLDEAGHRLLLRLLAAQGDRDGAAVAYAHCCQLLQRHADAEPAQATRALATAIALGTLGPQAPAATPAAALAPPPLVGRDTELHTLRQAVNAGGRLLLDGEPGLGKTCLLAALAEGQPGVLRVAAQAGDAEVPFASLARLLGALPAWLARAGQGRAARRPWPQPACDELARLMPDWGTPPARQAQAHRLVQALRDLLATCHAQGLQALLVDDLQWADASSLGLLLGGAAAAGGPAWVLAQRSGALPAALQAALAAPGALGASDGPGEPGEPGAPGAPGTRWQRLSLQPLQLDGVLALLRASPLPVADAPAWAAVLQSRSLGNPLHLLETLAALRHAQGDAVFRQPPPSPQALPVPAALEALLQARVDRLDPPARQLARLAALAGNLFSADLAIALMHTDAFTLGELWASLETALVLRGKQLAHDSLRQPLLNAWPEPVRSALHAQVAEAATRLRAPAADVALHWQLAGQWSAAATAYARAAAEAFALGAREAEHQLWQRAAACHERLGRHDAAFSARCQAGDAALAALPPEQVDALLAALADAVRQPLQQVDVDILRARLALTRYRFAEALPACRAALEALDALAVSTAPADGATAGRRLRASCLLASALAGSGALAEALARVEADAAAVQCAGDHRLQLDHVGTRAYVLVWAGRMAEAETAYGQALDHARALDDPAETSVLATNLAQRVLQRGAVRDALALALEATDALRSMGRADGVAAASAHIALGGIRWRLGHYSQALDDLRGAQALLAGEAANRWRMGCEVFVALIWLDLGCADLAEAALSPWPDALATGRLQRGLVELAIARHRGEPVLARLLAWQGDNAGDTLLTRLMLQLAIAREQPLQAALDLCRSVADQALAAGLAGVQQAAWWHEADALQRAGQPMLALQCLLPALARLDSCVPQQMYLPQAWWIAHQVFRQAGQGAQAADALAQGLRWVHDTARHRVPPAQRDSFLQRNPVNRALLLAAEAAGLAPPPTPPA